MLERAQKSVPTISVELVGRWGVFGGSRLVQCLHIEEVRKPAPLLRSVFYAETVGLLVSSRATAHPVSLYPHYAMMGVGKEQRKNAAWPSHLLVPGDFSKM